MNELKLTGDTPKRLVLYHMHWLAHKNSQIVSVTIYSGNEWAGGLQFKPDEARELAAMLLAHADAADALVTPLHTGDPNRKKGKQP